MIASATQVTSRQNSGALGLLNAAPTQPAVGTAPTRLKWYGSSMVGSTTKARPAATSHARQAAGVGRIDRATGRHQLKESFPLAPTVPKAAGHDHGGGAHTN